jgi:hypothetical protein
VVIRFLIRRALKVAFWIAIIFTLIVLLLQNAKIQNVLVNMIVGKGIEVVIVNSTGFFPFSFSIDRLQIKFVESRSIPDIDISNITVLLSKKMTHVRNIKIGKMTVISNNVQGPDFSDVQKIFQIACQKVVKRATIDELEFNGLKIRDISFLLDNALGIRVFNCVINEKTYETHIKVQNSNIILNLASSDFWIDVMYGLHDQHLSLSCRFKLHGVFSFDGVYSGNFVNGIIDLPEYNQKLSCQLSMTNGQIKAKTYAKNIGLFVDLDFDISNKLLWINEMLFNDKIAFKPFILRIGDIIPKIQILIKDGSIDIKDVDLFSETISIGQIEIKNVLLSEILRWQGMGAGVIDGKGTYANGTGYFTAKLHDWDLGEIKMPVLDIRATWRENGIAATLRYNLLKKWSTIDCKLVIENWIPSSKSIIKAKARGEFMMQNYGVGNRQFADGHLKYDIDVAGIISQPVFSGSLVLKNLAYMNPKCSTFIKGGTILATIRNNCIIINKIYATDDGTPRGTITGGGKIVFSKDKLDTDVSVDFHDFNIVELNELYGKLNGKITAKGDILRSLQISGDLYSKDTKVDVSRLITKSSRSMEIIEPKKQSGTKNQKKNVLIQWPIDIKFTFKNGLEMVSEFGINSRWDGGASVFGDTSEPKYQAEITMTKGFVKVSGQKFNLKDGKIWTDSSQPDVINVQVSAVKSLDNIKVGAKFIQNADGARVTFFSKPYVSNVDILSYLLFNKRSSEISTGEALILFSMMGKLSNNGGFDIVDKLQSVFGIDALEIKKSTDAVSGERSSVSVGKSIGTMKISIDQGVGKDTTKVVVEKQLTKKAKLALDLSGKNSLGCGLGWNKRY